MLPFLTEQVRGLWEVPNAACFAVCKKCHSVGTVSLLNPRFYPESGQSWQVWGLGERRLLLYSHQSLEKKTVTTIKSLPPFYSFY